MSQGKEGFSGYIFIAVEGDRNRFKRANRFGAVGGGDFSSQDLVGRVRFTVDTFRPVKM